MPFDPRLIRESFAAAEASGEQMVEHFYTHLFAHNPLLRDLFPEPMAVERDRLFPAIANATAHLDDTESLVSHLRQLGVDHRKHDLAPEHYQAVATSLLATLSTFIGRAWTADVEAAWRSACQVGAEIMVDAAESVPEHMPRRWDADVVGHDRRSFDIAVITVRPRSAFPYTPGQFLSVTTPHTPRMWRWYSIANSPRADGTLDLHVRAVKGGEVSQALVDRTRVGEVVQFGPAIGTMALDITSPRALLCVAGGTGLAPIKAIVEDVARRRRRRRVHLFVGARTAEQLYDLPDLVRLVTRHEWLTTVLAVSDDPTYPGEQGLLPDVVVRHGSWDNHDAYVCGPPGMVVATRDRLVALGVPRARIRYDGLLPDEPPTSDGEDEDNGQDRGSQPVSQPATELTAAGLPRRVPARHAPSGPPEPGPPRPVQPFPAPTPPELSPEPPSPPRPVPRAALVRPPLPLPPAPPSGQDSSGGADAAPPQNARPPGPADGGADPEDDRARRLREQLEARRTVRAWRRAIAPPRGDREPG